MPWASLSLRKASAAALKVRNARAISCGASAERFPFAGKCRRVRRLHRAEAAIAAAPERGADRAASGMRHRPKAGRALDHHADGAALLAFDADAVRGNRGFAPGQECGDHLGELVFVDRAAAQLEIDGHVRRDGRRGGERLDIVRPRIDGGDVTRSHRRNCAAPGCRRRSRRRRW